MSRRILRPNHAEPGPLKLGFFLLPYGDYYDKTKVFLKAKRGDKIRFFQGPDVRFDFAYVVSGKAMCEALARIRYGHPWKACYKRWQRYARMEGCGRDILLDDKCILVAYYVEENSVIDAGFTVQPKGQILP